MRSYLKEHSEVVMCILMNVCSVYVRWIIKKCLLKSVRKVMKCRNPDIKKKNLYVKWSVHKFRFKVLGSNVSKYYKVKRNCYSLEWNVLNRWCNNVLSNVRNVVMRWFNVIVTDNLTVPDKVHKGHVPDSCKPMRWGRLNCLLMQRIVVNVMSYQSTCVVLYQLLLCWIWMLMTL